LQNEMIGRKRKALLAAKLWYNAKAWALPFEVSARFPACRFPPTGYLALLML